MSWEFEDEINEQPLHGGGDWEFETPTGPTAIEALQQREQQAQQAPSTKPEYSVERFGGQLKEGAKDIARQASTGYGQAAGVAKSFLEKIPATPYSAVDVARKAYGAIKPAAMKVAAQPSLAKDPKYLESAGFWEDVARVGPQAVAQIGAGFATGGAGATLLMGTQIAGATFEDQVAKGVDPDRAARAGLANAIMQSPLEAIGLNKTMKLWKLRGGALNKLKQLGTTLGVESLTEFLQAFPEAAASIWGEGVDKTKLEQVGQFIDDFGKTAKQGAYEALVTLPITAVTGVGGVTMGGKQAAADDAPKAIEQETGSNEAIIAGIKSGEVSPSQAMSMKEFYPELSQEIDAAVQELAPAALPKDALPQMMPQPKSAKESAWVFEDEGAPVDDAYAAFEQAGFFKTPAELNQDTIDSTNIAAENELEQNKFAREQNLRYRMDSAPKSAGALESGPTIEADPPPADMVEAAPPQDTKQGQTELPDAPPTLVKEAIPTQELAQPEDTTKEFNSTHPGSDIKYDGQQDRSAINKPPLYSFTAYSGPARGASFSVEAPTVDNIKAKLDAMVELRSDGHKDRPIKQTTVQSPKGAISSDKIRAIIESQEYGVDEHEAYGLRFMTPNPVTGEDVDISIGGGLDNSYNWPDGVPTDEELHGASAVEIDLDNIDDAIKKVLNYRNAKGRVVLVGVDQYGYGTDGYNDEILVTEGSVLDVFDLSNQSIQPDKALSSAQESAQPIAATKELNSEHFAENKKKAVLGTYDLKKKLTDQTGSSQMATDILNHAIAIKQTGLTSYTKFFYEMKRTFKDAWDKIKSFMRRIWDTVNNEVGGTSLERKGPKHTKAEIDALMEKLRSGKAPTHGKKPISKKGKPAQAAVTKAPAVAKKGKPGGYAATLAPVTQQDYIDNRNTRKKLGQRAYRRIAASLSEAVEGTDKFLGAISTRLGNISPKLKHELRALDYNISQNAAKAVKSVEPMLRKAKGAMTKNDFIDWDYARKNSDKAKIDELVAKYGLSKEYTEYRKTLDSIRKDGLDVGLVVGEIEEYAPRVLKDSRGFLSAIEKDDEWPIYSKRLRERADGLGITVDDMAPDMKADMVSNMILGGGFGLSGPAATKQRKLKKILAELNQFYMDSDSALIAHIYSMRKGIEARRFFGRVPQLVAEMKKRLRLAESKLREIRGKLKTAPNDASLKKSRDKYYGLQLQYEAYIDAYAMQRDYKENIGAYVIDLINNGEVDARQERIITEILNARFHEKGATGNWKIYKDFSYIDTMGSPTSALTQIGDLTWSAYEGGLVKTIKNASKSLAGRSKIKKEDIGLERIAQEFADPGKLGKAVEVVFKMVGLSKMDSIGKEALMNSALEVYQKRARKKPQQLRRDIKNIFENETDSVIDDLKRGVITDNVKLLIYNRVLDFQPMALSEMPQKYLSAGNGRIFYMLKTFTIKQFDVFRNEVYNKIKNGDRREKIKGITNLARLSMYFVLANAGADALKDLLLGRKTDLSDRAMDNILRLFGISKFVTWKARTEGVGSAMAKQILPPFKFIDSATKDIVKAGDDKGLETLSSVPVIGKLLYWHMGRGVGKRGDLWDRRFSKKKKKLKKVFEAYERSSDKRRYLKSHAPELRSYRAANRLQGQLNKIRSKINRLKGQRETISIKKLIQRLEAQRTDKIKRYLDRKNQ